MYVLGLSNTNSVFYVGYRKNEPKMPILREGGVKVEVRLGGPAACPMIALDRAVRILLR